jgi:hypothetical protein
MQSNNTPIWRRKCDEHYKQELAYKKGFDSYSQYQTDLDYKKAAKLGMTITEWRNSRHVDRKHMKTYCENIDGRLGYVCTATIIPHVGILSVDHIDGNPFNRHKSNYQTLCRNCHAHKTVMFKDYATPGRKKLKHLAKNCH